MAPKSSDILPVPVDKLPDLWPIVRKLICHRTFDMHRIHGRLLLGRDLLWVVASPDNKILGVLITSINNAPPTVRKCFRSPVPERNRSITVHIAYGRWVRYWMMNAVATITEYARQQKCYRLFLLARPGWRMFVSWWHPNPQFDTIGFARDRVFRQTVRHFRFQSPGYFRLVKTATPEDLKSCHDTLLYRNAKDLYIFPERSPSCPTAS